MTDQEKINQLKDAHMSLRIEMRKLQYAECQGSLESTIDKALEDDIKVIYEILYT